MVKRRFEKIMAVVLTSVLVLSLAACSKADPSTSTDTNPTQGAEVKEPEPTEAGAEVSEPTVALEKKTLKIITWSNQGSVDAIKALSAKYMEKYPNVTVELTDVDTKQYENLQNTRLQANDVDIVSLGGGSFLKEKVDWAPTEAPIWQKLCDSGSLLDITDQPWLSNWSSGAQACVYDNKTWGVSTGTNAMNGIFYDKALFAEHNWSIPNTWAEFEKLCTDMQAAGITPLTCGGGDGWPYAMLVHGVVASTEVDYESYVKGLWTGEAAYNDSTGLMVYQRMDFLNKNMEPGFKGISYAEVIGRFVNGKAAMLMDGSWQATEIEKANPDFEFGYFPLPGTNTGVSFQGKFDLYFAINANSNNTQEALNWMEMLSDNANYTDFVNTCGFIPTMDNVEVTNAFIKDILPYTTNLKSSWGQYYRQPAGVGQYALGSVGFNGQYLESAGGPIETPEELADLTQKDFSDAVNATK
jgi:raffinose/stachyose/melibiose transport system substrate-binding protein